jgi:uncharacterized lipoprotein
MKSKLVVAVVLMNGLCGCGIADHYQAQSRMEKSQDAYRQCLLQNTADASRCSELKQFDEQDKAAYEKT